MYKIRKKWPKWNDDDIAWLLRMMRSLFADMTSRGGCCSVCAQFVCGGISDVFFWREIWNVSKIYMSVGVYKNQHSPIRRYHIYIKVDEHKRYNNGTSYLSDPRRSIWNWKSLKNLSLSIIRLGVPSILVGFVECLSLSLVISSRSSRSLWSFPNSILSWDWIG